MSQWRNLSNDERGVLYGNPRPQVVSPDGVVTVDDDADVAYAHQSDLWGPADSGATSAVDALEPSAPSAPSPTPAPSPVDVPSAPADAPTVAAPVTVVPPAK